LGGGVQDLFDRVVQQVVILWTQIYIIYMTCGDGMGKDGLQKLTLQSTHPQVTDSTMPDIQCEILLKSDT
jgi:hypothetical protein